MKITPIESEVGTVPEGEAGGTRNVRSRASL
jgi:hypothetical protein